jgi:DNA-binding transcriptional MerR regulator
MKLNLQKAQFVNSDVMRAAGLNAATVQTWVNRGLIQPASEQNPGHGQRRLYSTKNVIWFAVVGRLTEWGLTVSLAVDIAEAFTRMLQAEVIDTEKWLMDPSPKHKVKFPDYESFWVAIGKDENGRYYTTQKPWTIHENWDDEKYKRKFRAAKGDKIMLILDLVGIVVPVLREIEAILSEQEGA